MHPLNTSTSLPWEKYLIDVTLRDYVIKAVHGQYIKFVSILWCVILLFLLLWVVFFVGGGGGGGYDFKLEINPLHVEKQIPANHDKFQ